MDEHTPEEQNDTDLDFEFEEEDLTPKKLRERLKTCTAEKQEYLLGWQRAKADLINARKEFEDQKKSVASYAHESMILDLSSVLDSFDSAFGNKDAWESVDKNWRMGIEYIHAQLLKVLGEYGLVSFDATGAPFMPTEHVSVDIVDTDDASKDNSVAETLQKGLSLKGKIIKPAKVKVYHYNR